MNLTPVQSNQTMPKVVLMVALLHLVVVYYIARGVSQAPTALPTIPPIPIAANTTKPVVVRIHAQPKVQSMTTSNVGNNTISNTHKKAKTKAFAKPAPTTKTEQFKKTAMTEPSITESAIPNPVAIEPETTMAMANTTDIITNKNAEAETQNETSDSNTGDRLLPSPIFLPQSHALHLNNPQPEYPSLSRTLREQGRVLLDVHINIHGDVTDVRIRQSSGYPRLDNAALTAVKAWHYIPARLGKSPIALWHVQPISFVLNRTQ